MTKKHFLAIAKEIADMTDRNSALIAAQAFCRVAHSANPRFDQSRFLSACNL